MVEPELIVIVPVPMVLRDPHGQYAWVGATPQWQTGQIHPVATMPNALLVRIPWDCFMAWQPWSRQSQLEHPQTMDLGLRQVTRRPAVAADLAVQGGDGVSHGPTPCLAEQLVVDVRESCK